MKRVRGRISEVLLICWFFCIFWWADDEKVKGRNETFFLFFLLIAVWMDGRRMNSGGWNNRSFVSAATNGTKGSWWRAILQDPILIARHHQPRNCKRKRKRKRKWKSGNRKCQKRGSGNCHNLLPLPLLLLLSDLHRSWLVSEFWKDFMGFLWDSLRFYGILSGFFTSMEASGIPKGFLKVIWDSWGFFGDSCGILRISGTSLGISEDLLRFSGILAGFLASLGPSEAFLKISWDSFGILWHFCGFYGILLGFFASLEASGIPKGFLKIIWDSWGFCGDSCGILRISGTSLRISEDLLRFSGILAGFLASLGPSEAFLKISWDSFGILWDFCGLLGILVGFLASLGPSWIPGRNFEDYLRFMGFFWDSLGILWISGSF